MFRPKILLALAAALALGFGARSASADTTSFYLNNPNGALSPYPGPYGTVTVDRISTTVADFTFSATSPYSFVDGGSAGVNINGVLADISVSNVSSGSAHVGSGGQNQLDGFGVFNVNINQSSASTLYSTITFRVTDSQANWTTVSQVLNGNSQGYFVAAHINSGAVDSQGNGITGFSTNGPPPTATPEPSTLAIAGLGALAFMGYGLRRRMKK